MHQPVPKLIKASVPSMLHVKYSCVAVPMKAQRHLMILFVVLYQLRVTITERLNRNFFVMGHSIWDSEASKCYFQLSVGVGKRNDLQYEQYSCLFEDNVFKCAFKEFQRVFFFKKKVVLRWHQCVISKTSAVSAKSPHILGFFSFPLPFSTVLMNHLSYRIFPHSLNFEHLKILIETPEINISDEFDCDFYDFVLFSWIIH